MILIPLDPFERPAPARAEALHDMARGLETLAKIFRKEADRLWAGEAEIKKEKEVEHV